MVADGSKLVVQGFGIDTYDIETLNPDGSGRTPVVATPANEIQPDWQPGPEPLPPGYARPKGATPIHVSLVIAYRPCGAPNRQHGPPLAFSSCSPPEEASDYLTVGTADANGQPTKSVGSVKLKTIPGDPITPDDESDVRVVANLSDVRCKAAQAYPCSGAALADYTGELQAALPLRITDKSINYFNQTEAQTMDLFAFPVTVPCAATADPTIGADCSLDTTIDALAPGAIREHARAIWQVGPIEIRDGGADGSAASDDFTTFARQGIFVP